MPWLFLRTWPCLGPSGETLGCTCQKSPAKNLSQKTVPGSSVFPCEGLGLLEESLSGCPLSAMAESIPMPQTGRGLALLSPGLPSGAKYLDVFIKPPDACLVSHRLSEELEGACWWKPVGKGCAISGSSVPISGGPVVYTAWKGGCCGAEGCFLSTSVEQEDIEFFTVPTEPRWIRSMFPEVPVLFSALSWYARLL